MEGCWRWRRWVRRATFNVIRKLFEKTTRKRVEKNAIAFPFLFPLGSGQQSLCSLEPMLLVWQGCPFQRVMKLLGGWRSFWYASQIILCTSFYWQVSVHHTSPLTSLNDSTSFQNGRFGLNFGWDNKTTTYSSQSTWIVLWFCKYILWIYFILPNIVLVETCLWCL